MVAFLVHKYDKIILMRYISRNLEETHKIAKDFISNLNPYRDRAMVVGLYGDLGSGKTSFTQGVAAFLGVSENVTSPTFVIEKVYELTEKKFSHLVHIDAYRLEKSDELSHLGFQEILADNSNLVLIEWPEKVEDIMPQHIKISFKTLEKQDSREIDIDY